MRLATPRLGDSGEQAILELVGKHDRIKRAAERPAFDDDESVEVTDETVEEDRVLQIAASAELHSQHPFAQSIVDEARRRGHLLDEPSAYRDSFGPDEGGRLSETVALTPADAERRFELLFHSGPYFAAQAIPKAGMQIIQEVVIRFAMPDPDARYHMPLMLAPNSYSVWWSG